MPSTPPDSCLQQASSVVADHPPWQLIESAPKTSRSRLVWCPELQNTYLVYWVYNGWHHFGGMFEPLDETPTHWMPLPAPPEQTNGT
jgi:hypothetical protein